MDSNAILSRLNQLVPGAVLERRRFGRSETLSVWVDLKAIRKIAEAVSADPKLKLDWLENLSAAQVDEALVLSYVLRSTEGSLTLILRGTLAPKAPDEEVDVGSVRDFWPMGAPFENEAGELYGIRFLDRRGEPIRAATRILPEGWSGFPLRKAPA